jgi:hypothetical protein
MLPRFTLKDTTQSGSWDLKNPIGDIVKRFSKKTDATKSGVLERTMRHGTVRIRNKDGRIEEERTFPRSEDPRRHTG